MFNEIDALDTAESMFVSGVVLFLNIEFVFCMIYLEI